MMIPRDVEDRRAAAGSDQAVVDTDLAALGVDKKGHQRALFLYDGG